MESEGTRGEASETAMETKSEVQEEGQKIDLGSSESFSREEVEQIVSNAIENKISGLKSNNYALKDEKLKAQKKAKELESVLSELGGEDSLHQLLDLKQKIEKDEELRLFTNGDREKYNERILSRARQDHSNQMKRIQEDLNNWKTQAEQSQSKFQQREIEKSIVDGCAESGVNPRLYRAMSAQIKDDVVFDDETGKILVRDGEGVRYGTNGQPMEVRELIEMMREEQPELFLQSTGGGATGTTSNFRRATGVSAEDMRNMPVAEYARLRKEGVIR